MSYDLICEIINECFRQDWKKAGDNYFKILSWNADATDTDEEDLNDLIQQRMETMIEILLR